MGKLIEFPKVVKLATLWNEGIFGISCDNVCDVTVHETSIMIWFSEGKEDGRPWDLSLEYATPQDADTSYHELLDALRQIRFKQRNRGSGKISKIIKDED